jgi:hypothetical protein
VNVALNIEALFSTAVCRRALSTVAIETVLVVLVGCGGAQNGSNNQPDGGAQPSSGTLAISPAAIDFGAVAAGGTGEVSGTLTAIESSVTISTASWNGAGFSLSGIVFPKTIAAGQSTSFKVIFSPQSSGSASGSLKFFSDASSSPTEATLAGSGIGASQHSVSLNWNASSNAVEGYYVYRSTSTGGPYSRVSGLQPATLYTDSSVGAGQTYYYVVTAVNSSVESGYSNEARADIPQ